MHPTRPIPDTLILFALLLLSPACFSGVDKDRNDGPRPDAGLFDGGGDGGGPGDGGPTDGGPGDGGTDPDGGGGCPPGDPDTDRDGTCDGRDNCPTVANPDQADADGDGLGDACDPCLDDPGNDPDNDGVCAAADNCPNTRNSNQADLDGDGLGDACDACPRDADNDLDGDGVCGDVDNCPLDRNAQQRDNDSDGTGNVCDPCPDDPLDDADRDGVCGDVDNCPELANPGQGDGDGDGVGDLCDNCPAVPNPAQTDTNGNGIGDLCEATTCTAGSNLATAYDSNNQAPGNIFDVLALSSLRIDTLDVNCDSGTTGTQDFAVYTRAGSYVGFDKSSTGWTLAGSAPGVPCSPEFSPTVLALSLNLTMTAGETRAFWVTNTSGGDLGYTGNSASPPPEGVGGTNAANLDLEIKTGVGVRYPLGGQVFRPRRWNGTIHYCAIP